MVRSSDGRRALGGSSYGLVMVIIAVAVLGVAGYLAYAHLAQGSSEQAGHDRYEQGGEWRQRIVRVFSTDETKRFQRVQLSVVHDPSEKADHAIEITGAVASQADLDALQAMLKQGDLVPPIRYTLSVTVDAASPR